MYRSAIFCDDETQFELARKSAEKFQQELDERGVTGTLSSSIRSKGKLKRYYK